MLHKENILKKERDAYHKNREKHLIRRKKERSTPEHREKSRIRAAHGRANNLEKFRKSVRKWQNSNRIKINAHAKVHRAVVNGILIRSEICNKCSKKCKTEGHHMDYNKPLDVQWLCRKCHAELLQKGSALKSTFYKTA